MSSDDIIRDLMLKKLTMPDLDLMRQIKEASGAMQFADLAQVSESMLIASDHLNRQVNQVWKEAQAANARHIASTMSDFSRAMEGAARDAFPVITEISRLYREQLAVAHATVQRLASAADIFRSLDQVVGRLNETPDLSKWFRAQIGVADLASTRSVYTALADQLTAVVGKHLGNAPVGQSFASRLVDHLYEVSAAEDEENLDQAVGQIETLLEEGWERLPKSSLSRSAFRQEIRAIVVALLFFLLGRLDNQQTESRILHRIAKLERSVSTQIEGTGTQIVGVEARIEGLEAQVEGMAARDEGRQLYTVTRSVPLRSGPSSQQKVLCRLAPNIVVEVVEEQDKWLLVEYFDFGAAEVRQGWVFKRFLVPLDSLPGSLP